MDSDVCYQRVELAIFPRELNLDFTLGCGQAFRWRKLGDGSWEGVIPSRYARLRQRRDRIEALVIPDQGARELLERYFRLDMSLAAVGHELRERDRHVGQLFERFAGLRLVRQDPTETLLSFVCSAANSIPRIAASVERLSLTYGREICVLDGVCYHEFPEVHLLANEDERTLATMEGLGFRGRNLKDVASQILARPRGWLESLMGIPYSDAKRELTSLRCVGEKIADCVCLFALRKDEAVPVDTHVRQIAQRLYLSESCCKTVTPALYRRISDLFRERFGRYAGWAQQYLYYEDLLRVRKKGNNMLDSASLRSAQVAFQSDVLLATDLRGAGSVLVNKRRVQVREKAYDG